MANKKYFLGIYEEDMWPDEERFNMETTTKGRSVQKLVTSNKSPKSIEAVVKMWTVCKQREETQHRLFVIMNDDNPKLKQVVEVHHAPQTNK